MKKLLLIVIIIACSTSYAQNTTLKTTTIKEKYENVFYRSPGKYNQEQKFKVSTIKFHTTYEGSKSKNTYQIQVDGKVNNKKEEILYNAKSIEELEYYKNVFKGRYKKILLYSHDRKVGSKTYHDTAIVVEY